MTQFVLSTLIALFIQVPAANPQAQQPPAPAAIEGRVVRNGTNEPVARAQIMVTRAPAPIGPGQPVPQPAAPAGGRGAAPAGNAAIPAVVTESDGKFVIRDLPPGSYRLSAARNGYSKQEYGQRSLRTAGAVITLAAGQNMKDVVFKLIPAGTISGRITDSTGEPLAGVTVQLLRSIYDAQGKKSLQPSVNVKTNDLGEYRLYWITQGTYYLNATTSGSYLQSLMQSQMNSAMNTVQGQGGATNPSAQQTLEAMFGINTNEVVEPGFATTYYPNTADSSRALSVDVQQGAEIRGMDIALVRQMSYRIQGRVVDSRSGETPQTAIIQLASRANPNGQAPKPMTSYDSTTGNYEFRDVPPGEYIAIGIVPTITAGGPPVIGTAMANVDVSGANVDGVTLTIRQGATIPGQLNVEGAQNIAAVPGIDRMRVRLIPASDQAINTIQPATPKPDGTFQLENVSSGDFRVGVANLPPNYYLKAARFSGSDALNTAVTINPSSAGAVDILVSPNAGQVTGTLVDKDQKPVPTTQIVLIPDRARDRRDTYKVASSDGNGKFTIQGIPPGSYKLFSWEDIEPFAYYDTEVLRQFDGRGVPVSISESSRISQEVKIIPAGNQ